MPLLCRSVAKPTGERELKDDGTRGSAFPSCARCVRPDVPVLSHFQRGDTGRPRRIYNDACEKTGDRLKPVVVEVSGYPCGGSNAVYLL